MPRQNRFQHQEYRSAAPTSTYQLLSAEPPPPWKPGADPPDSMRRDGEQLRQAGVRAVFLLHGTFVGQDVLGVARKIARIWPSAARHLHQLQKYLVDAIARDAGNYSVELAHDFQEAINAGPRSEIPVELVYWSGENNHAARADGAICLLDRLGALPGEPGQRVLLWGHSHGGNVLALATNLLASDSQTRERFFQACRTYYRDPLTGWVDLPMWERVRGALEDDRSPLRQQRLDMVTFGTPIRYGWDTDGYERLLHVTDHRPAPDRPPYLAKFPPSIDEVMNAAGGDYIQQLGVAGTDFPPGLVSWRAWTTELRLNELLQPGLSRLDLLERLRCGMRVPDEGHTLLIDFGIPQEPVHEHLAGHGVYTRRNWLPFQLRQIVEKLYV